MTAMVLPIADAPSTTPLHWDTLNWSKAVAEVRKLQMRIAKAYREGKKSKAKALQWILTHSFSAKLLAVKRVTQNRGAKTPGVDNIVWKTPAQKMQAALSLKRRGYKTKPLKRIYIPKKQKGKFRPLSIPVMECRAQQALYLLSLDPIAEEMADKNSFGFRSLRSTADAIERCFKILAQKTSSQYILEGDISACFDSISHSWLMNNTPMDKEMLRKWLAAGYIEKEELHPTIRGTPQGGTISPTLLTITLSGLEKAIKLATTTREKVNVCVYADDFIATGATVKVLEEKVKPAIAEFLRERGLTLSLEKTKITHINEGFDFLGMNVRKYNDKLIIKPAKSSIKRLLSDIREITKCHKAIKTEYLIRTLNPKIRGWVNYYRHVCSKATFSYIDHCIFKAIWGWAKRRHPNKGIRWVKRKYFHTKGNRHWKFFSIVQDKHEKQMAVELVAASSIPIKRHCQIRGEANPYNPVYHDYFHERISRQIGTAKSRKPSWWSMLIGDNLNQRKEEW
jgi:RNA-directed DNA polymerase